MKNKIETPSKKRQIVKSVKKQIFQERKACSVCGRSYKYLERHMRNAHRPPPCFRSRLEFCVKGLKHIFIVLTPFIFLYLIPFPDFVHTVLFYILGLFFIIYYLIFLLSRYPGDGSESVASYSYPQGIIFFTYLCMIDYLNMHDSVSEFIAQFIRESFFMALRRQDLLIPSPRLLFFFVIPGFWIAGCIFWEISLLRKRLKDISIADFQKK